MTFSKLLLILPLFAVITVGILQSSYRITEGTLLGPPANVSVCAKIEVGFLGTDVSVILSTPLSGPSVTGMYIRTCTLQLCAKYSV